MISTLTKYNSIRQINQLYFLLKKKAARARASRCEAYELVYPDHARRIMNSFSGGAPVAQWAKLWPTDLADRHILYAMKRSLVSIMPLLILEISSVLLVFTNYICVSSTL